MGTKWSDFRKNLLKPDERAENELKVKRTGGLLKSKDKYEKTTLTK